MYFFGSLVRKKSFLFKRILFLLCFGAQSVATTTKTSQSSQSNDVSFDPPKYRNAVASGVDRLFASKEVFVKDNMMHLFYKADKSTIRDDVNFDEVVVCKRVKSDTFSSEKYNYIVCPDDAGPRWPAYGQLIRDSSNGNAYCCGLDGWQDCCSKDQLYFHHPNFHPSKRPFDPINVDIKREEKPPEKMKTSTIVIIVCSSIAGLLIIVAIACLICCLCDCCCFAMFNKNRSPTGGKIAGGYATKAPAVTPGAYRATNSTATAYPAGGSYGYPSGGTYPAGSGGYAGGYAGGYPANVR